MQFFTSRHDWESEVERCHCNEEWRVCSANENYQLSASLPQGFVVPRSLSDNQILKASKHFMGNRPPVWCWGHINKCVIVRMSVLHNFITDTYSNIKSLLLLVTLNNLISIKIGNRRVSCLNMSGNHIQIYGNL